MEKADSMMKPFKDEIQMGLYSKMETEHWKNAKREMERTVECSKGINSKTNDHTEHKWQWAAAIET